VTGYAYGAGFPQVNPTQPASAGFYDAFLAVLNDAGRALEFSTYLGGTGHDKARAVAVDRFGNAYVTGETFSTDFPALRALQPGYAGGSFDGFVAKVALGSVPVLHLSANALDFGAGRVGLSSPPQLLTLTNIGGGELVLESVQTTGDFAATSDCVPLAPGASCAVSITFAPSVRGERTGSMKISHNAAGSPTEVALRGVGLAPEISLSASRVSFGHQLVGTASAPQVLTLANSGTASLELSGIAVSGEFMQSNDCPASLAVAASCTITLMFAPAAPGERAGGLTVTNALPEEARTAALSGIGTDYSLSASPGAAAVAAGESATFTLTVTPAGGFQGTVSFACAGAPPAASCSISPASLVMDGSNAADAKVTIMTKARARSLPVAGPRSEPDSVRHLGPLFWLMALRLTARRIREVCRRLAATRLRPAFGLAGILLLAIFWTACGGGGGSVPHPPATDGTPAGTYTLTVSGTFDGVSRSTSIKLTVN
jgi:hypothetical protein